MGKKEIAKFSTKTRGEDGTAHNSCGATGGRILTHLVGWLVPCLWRLLWPFNSTSAESWSSLFTTPGWSQEDGYTANKVNKKSIQLMIKREKWHGAPFYQSFKQHALAKSVWSGYYKGEMICKKKDPTILPEDDANTIMSKKATDHHATLPFAMGLIWLLLDSL